MSWWGPSTQETEFSTLLGQPRPRSCPSRCDHLPAPRPGPSPVLGQPAGQPLKAGQPAREVCWRKGRWSEKPTRDRQGDE